MNGPAKSRSAKPPQAGAEPRPGVPADAAAVAACVRAAYAHYVPRMGGEPAPMRADYVALTAAGQVHVLERGGRLAGVIVLYPKDGCLFVENVAVDPGFQGRGLGRRLMAFAEDQARAQGLPAIRLYTNIHMVENLAFYGGLGYAETGRAREDGYDRIYFEKRLD